MAQIREEDLEGMTNDQIRSYIKQNNKHVLPEKVRNYIDAADEYEPFAVYQRKRRVSSLLKEIIIKRFLYAKD